MRMRINRVMSTELAACYNDKDEDRSLVGSVLLVPTTNCGCELYGLPLDGLTMVYTNNSMVSPSLVSPRRLSGQ